VNVGFVWSELFARDFYSDAPEVKKRKEINEWQLLYQYFHKNKLVLRLQISPTEFSQGDRAQITITLKNISKCSVRVAVGKTNTIETRGLYIGGKKELSLNYRLFGFSLDKQITYQLVRECIHSVSGTAATNKSNGGFGLLIKDNAPIFIALVPCTEGPIRAFF